MSNKLSPMEDARKNPLQRRIQQETKSKSLLLRIVIFKTILCSYFILLFAFEYMLYGQLSVQVADNSLYPIVAHLLALSSVTYVIFNALVAFVYKALTYFMESDHATRLTLFLYTVVDTYLFVVKIIFSLFFAVTYLGFYRDIAVDLSLFVLGLLVILYIGYGCCAGVVFLGCKSISINIVKECLMLGIRRDIHEERKAFV